VRLGKDLAVNGPFALYPWGIDQNVRKVQIGSTL
jgi:hypothetical protein